ncbi:MAG: hypothetical protein V3W19_16385 [Desulfatiglandales bacterium]
MNFFRLLPVILSALILGAHFFRAGGLLFVLIALAIPVILLIHRPWVARLVQIILVGGGLEWVRTLVRLASERQAIGEPWNRLAIILGGVAILTACSALLFSLSALRKLYSLGPNKENKSSSHF